MFLDPADSSRAERLICVLVEYCKSVKNSAPEGAESWVLAVVVLVRGSPSANGRLNGLPL